MTLTLSGAHIGRLKYAYMLNFVKLLQNAKETS